MTVTAKTLRDYLKTLLSDSTGLSGVHSWHNAQPPVFPSSPFGWVRPLGGAKEIGVSGARKTNDSFEVVVVVKSGNWNTAEDAALGYKEAIETAIEANPTLNNQVSAAWASNRESQQFNEGKECFSAWKVTVTTWRFS